MTEPNVIQFIREVEKHQCVYNITMSEYSNRDETKRAWGEIAEAINWTESECKEKWRKIRIAFLRSLKQLKASNSTTNKPYYLYDYLTFLLPFIKNGDQPIQDHEDINLSVNYYDEEKVLMPKSNKIRKMELDIDSDNESRSEPNGHIVYINDRLVETPKSQSNLNETCPQNKRNLMVDQYGNTADSRKRRKMEDVEDNPRKMFLLSILPDIESFTDDEMRIFRRTVVRSIDNIFDARKS